MCYIPFMREFVSKSLEETRAFSKEWLQNLCEKKQKSDKKKAITVGLSGHLGAGKTAFVRELAKELGIKEEITSPTFVIMKIYKTSNEIFKKLVHIDAYRLERPDELKILGLDNIEKDKDSLVMIEWPENVSRKTDEFMEFESKQGSVKISVQ